MKTLQHGCVIMEIRHVAFYELRIALGGAALFGMLMLPAFALLTILQNRGWGAIPPNATLARDMALLLSLCAAIATGHLMNIERDEGFDLLRRSTPEPFWRLPLMRILGALVMLFLSATVTLIIYVVAYETQALQDIILPVLPPVIFMLGLSLFLSGVIGNAWITMGLLIAYWFFEYQTRGAYTQSFYLFNSVMPNSSIDLDLNRALLLGGGIALLLGTIWWNGWRRSRG